MIPIEPGAAVELEVAQGFLDGSLAQDRENLVRLWFGKERAASILEGPGELGGHPVRVTSEFEVKNTPASGFSILALINCLASSL